MKKIDLEKVFRERVQPHCTEREAKAMEAAIKATEGVVYKRLRPGGKQIAGGLQQ